MIDEISVHLQMTEVIEREYKVKQHFVNNMRGHKNKSDISRLLSVRSYSRSRVLNILQTGDRVQTKEHYGNRGKM